MKVTALLTGRGNNTLKDKNVLDILGRPVLYYPAHAGRMATTIDNYYCSSDDEKILRAAEMEGYKRIVRPDYLGMPSSQHVDVIKHAISVIEPTGEFGNILVVILANNVTIKSEWIDIDLLLLNGLELGDAELEDIDIETLEALLERAKQLQGEAKED